MKTIFSLMLALVVTVAMTRLGAQGTFNCNSITQPRPLVRDSLGSPVQSIGFVVLTEVLNPTTGQFDGTLLETNKTGVFPLEPRPLLSGAGNGLFSAGVVLVPFLPPGAPATIRLRVYDTSRLWIPSDGESYNNSMARGQTIFEIPALGGVVDPITGVPSLPTQIVPYYTGMTVEVEIRYFVKEEDVAIWTSGNRVYLGWNFDGFQHFRTGYYSVSVESDPAQSALAREGNIYLDLKLQPWVQGIFDGTPTITNLSSAAMPNFARASVPLNTRDRPSGFYRVFYHYCIPCN